MKLLEYEAKNILKNAGLPVPNGTLISKAADPVSVPIVLKSQVPTGGRGKLGGVRVIENQTEIKKVTEELFNLSIKGFTPRVLLAEEKIAIKKELYLSLLINKEKATIQLMAHKKGGIEIEENDSKDFLTLEINESNTSPIIKQLTSYFEIDGEIIKQFINTFLEVFIKNDATLIEINPLVQTDTGELICGDCKMELDDAAAFRHPEWHFEYTPQNTNFVTLHEDGTVATIANGAGLAMATVDAVAAKSMMPANFLDIGGGANADSILAAFNQIVDFPNVKTIVINIFAGITRCDEVAKAIIAAREQIAHLPPLFIRLAGTNFEEAKVLLAEKDIPSLATLDECLEAAKEVVYA